MQYDYYDGNRYLRLGDSDPFLKLAINIGKEKVEEGLPKEEVMYVIGDTIIGMDEERFLDINNMAYLGALIKKALSCLYETHT